MFCRSTVLLALSLTGFPFALAQSEAPVSSASTSAPSPIGYATVKDALDALKSKPGLDVQITKPDGWTIINEPESIQWSFTPAGHAAHPAVVRRAIKVATDGGVYIDMSALCQAEKMPCDKLIEEFAQLNERIRQSIKGRAQK